MKIRSTAEQEKMPNGGMEVGLLSIAVLLVLFFAATAIIPEEKGVIINRITCWFGATGEEGHELVEIRVSSMGTLMFEEEEYHLEEFRKFIEKNPLSEEKVYMIHAHVRAPFGIVLQTRELLLEKGIPDDYAMIGAAYDF